VSHSSSSPLSEAEQIVQLKNQLAWAELNIQALEAQLRLERIQKYGPASEKLSDAQLDLLEGEPGVSAAEVQAESERERCRRPQRPRRRSGSWQGSIRDGRNCLRTCRAGSA
jgi:hypothetical protein